MHNDYMNKNYIVTLILAIVATISARAIEQYHFQSGTAVLKGRILNKPADEWNIISVIIQNAFTDEDAQVFTIPVAADGSFESRIPLPYSQSIKVQDVDFMFLAVDDTLEMTKDAKLVDEEGVTFVGNTMSANINRLWLKVRKHYFGEDKLLIKGLARDKIPAWKKQMVKKLDSVIADIESDRLPLPAGTSAFEKEVLCANLLSEPLMAIMENYRCNMTTGGLYNINKGELGEYNDFVASREKWLLDNPAMLFVIPSPGPFISYIGAYIMFDIAFSPKVAGESRADYYRRATHIAQERYGLKGTDLMQQIALSRHVFREDLLEEGSNPDILAEYFVAIIPLISNPIVAQHALDRYRQYVKQRELKVVEQKPITKGDSIFQRIIEPYKGNALYVHFWGMYCGPCRAEMLEEREKVERLKDKPVRFIYICDEKESPRESTEKWLTANNIKGEHVYVTHEEWALLAEKFNIYAPPFSIGIDKDGNTVTINEVNNYVYEMLK